MGLVDDVVRSINTKIDSALEQWLKVVPVTIATVSSAGAVTVHVQGSSTTFPAIMIAGQKATVGATGYALWHPGRTKPLVFMAAASGDNVDHVLGTAGEPALATNWQAYPGWAAPKFNRVNGIVILTGLVQRLSTTAPAGTVLFVLPAGYRPGGNLHIAVPANNGGTGVLNVMTDGTVKTNSPASLPVNEYISLSGVVFVAQN